MSTGKVYKDFKTGKLFWTQRIKGRIENFKFIKGYNYKMAEQEFRNIFPAMPKLTEIILPQEIYDEILYDFIPRWKEAKKKEYYFKMDSDVMVKRALTGFLGEACMEILLGVSVLDRDKDGRIAVGESHSFKNADLSNTGMDIGIKTVEYMKFPVVKRNVRRAQVINFMMDNRTFLVGGYASIRTLRDFQKSELILNDNLRNKRLRNGQIEKIAFWGLHQLVPITDLESLRTVYYKK